MTEKTDSTRLVGTGEAAKQLGVDRTTLGRWAATGLVHPFFRTAGGHLRWDVASLREQLAAIPADQR